MEEFVEKEQVNSWGDPVPVGLATFAASTIMFFALLTGRIPMSDVAAIMCTQLGIFVIQFTCSIISFKNKSTLGGSIYALFAGVAILPGALEMLTKVFGTTGALDAWVYLIISVVLLMWLPGFFKAPTTIALAVLCLDLAFWAMTIFNFGSPIFALIGGYLFLLCAIFSAYSAGALAMFEEFGKELFPMGAPWIK